MNMLTMRSLKMKFYGVVTLGILLSITAGCGSKKKAKQTPAPNNSGDQTANSGVPGPQGPQGPQGIPGVGHVFSHVVKDAGGQIIGKTSWEHALRFNDGQSFTFQLSDGANFTVSPYSGFFDGGAYCFYTSNDCTGTCMFPRVRVPAIN